LLYYENNPQIILVDNGSDDKRLEELKQLVRKHDFFFISEDEVSSPDLPGRRRIFYSLKANYGYAKGNNKGLELAHKIGFKYVAICNNDIVFTEPIISKLILNLELNQNTALVGPSVILGSTGKVYNPLKSRSSFYYLFWYKLFYPFLMPYHWLVARLFRFQGSSHSRLLNDKEYLSGCFFVANLQIFRAVGFFDEDTFLGSEEEILRDKLRKKGFSSLYYSDASIIHNHAQTSKMLSESESNAYTYSSQRYYVTKYKEYSHFKLKLIDFANSIWVHLWLPVKGKLKQALRKQR